MWYIIGAKNVLKVDHFPSEFFHKTGTDPWKREWKTNRKSKAKLAASDIAGLNDLGGKTDS